MVRIGSLCTGYGGLDMAVAHVLGGSLAWVADPDPAATRVLAHHHPTVPNLGDITTVDWSTVAPVDVLSAGFPCQPVSVAGPRRGTDDDRWIWPDVARAIGAVRPRLVFLENVPGLVVRGLDTVLADLAALGFDAQWMCLRASDIGAPHRRDRWFCLAWPAEDPDHPAREWTRPAPGRRGGAPTAHPGCHSRPHNYPHRAAAAGCGADARGESHGTPRRPGNTLVGECRPADGYRGPPPFSGRGGAATDPDGQPLRHQPDQQSERSGAAPTGQPGLPWGPYTAAITRWEHLTARPAPAPTEPGPRAGRPRLAPRFVEWMHGLSEGHVSGVPGLSRTDQLRLLGNGVVPQQAAAALADLKPRGAP